MLTAITKITNYMQSVIKIVKNGFIFLFIIAITGIFGWHFFRAHNAKDIQKDASEHLLLEKHEVQSEEAAEGESESANGAVIPDDPAPDYVGFCDVKFVIENGDRTRDVEMYLNGKEAYVFLPSYASLPNITIQLPDDVESLSIDEREIRDGDALKKIHADKIYDLAVKLSDDEEVPTLRSYDMYQLTFMQSENLPTLFIDTANGTMDYLNQDKTHWEPGEMVCLNADGTLDSEGDIRKIHGRGSSSWANKQKGYTFHTDTKISISGMKEATKWCLIANSYDATKMRNALAYAFARDIELPYAINCQYVDVFFNGNYNGNYLLCEAIEVADNRMDASDVDALVKIDRLGPDSVYFSWDNGTLEVLYPTDEEGDFYEYLRDRMNYIFTKIQECKTPEDYEKLKSFVDVDSFAKMYLINFMTNETDSNGLSTFYYYKIYEDKLYSGPAWDFDLGYGAEQDSRGRYYEYNGYGSGPSEKLIYNARFADHVAEILKEYDFAVQNIWLNRDEFKKYIQSSLFMSRKLFGNQSGSWMVEMGTQEANEYYLGDFLNKRIPLMYDTVFHPENYHRITIGNRIYWLKDGEKIPKDFEEFLCGKDGHLRYESGLTYLRNQPINWDMTLYTPPVATAPTDEPAAEDTLTAIDQNQDTVGSTASTIINEQSDEKGDIIMALLGIILLVTPGIISLIISGELKEVTRRELPRIFINYLVFEFLIILCSYGIITALKGSVTISFAGISRGETYTIFHSKVVCLIAGLFLVISIILGIIKPYFDHVKDRLMKKMPSPDVLDKSL